MRKFISKAKIKILGVASSVSAIIATIVSASANTTSGTGLSQHADAITEQFQGAATDIMPIIIGILGVGLGIFAIFKGIKLAKKMFGTVSNG